MASLCSTPSAGMRRTTTAFREPSYLLKTKATGSGSTPLNEGFTLTGCAGNISCHLFALSRYLCGDMMTTQTMPAIANSDEQLVEWSLTGDRDAFRKIVERYQSLVCSITYNATGSLTLSEDLAQETFVAAWKQLPELREPSQLRAWLCGITRFLVGKQLRRQGHEPIHAAETVDAIHELTATVPSRVAQAVTREEEAILWRALERIPDAYREPLILFYREQQSVERVAAELELSEDAVKQRLSRGRKLLHEEVIAFVEGTLSRTAPGQAFSGAVLAALPLTMGSV